MLLFITIGESYGKGFNYERGVFNGDANAVDDAFGNHYGGVDDNTDDSKNKNFDDSVKIMMIMMISLLVVMV